MEKIDSLYLNTDLSIEQIAYEVGVCTMTVQRHIIKMYNKDFRKARKSSVYKASKTGNLNPMSGKFGETHHNFVGEVSDGKGYIMVLKPDWYTGRKGSKHVFKHTVVMCEALNITELPAGMVIHHVDHNPTNNSLDNLALVTIKGHGAIHSRERATTTEKRVMRT